ncbi:unnamed protein product [Lepeophtheirus salmonis]|uniref:(salmon louse) hypothetical protein n=1 Tax=Lepeophtheirus salmonis TaxID=72036 RepID=A0A7R8CLR7_LEPSM|nr:unnamed protein product [Lepeophtheirus salmonis]CAF2859366.1 unnamed protein product [Lepeophtheirus salmonis]
MQSEYFNDPPLSGEEEEADVLEGDEEGDVIGELHSRVSSSNIYYDTMIPPSAADQSLMEALLMSKALTFKRSNSVDSTLSSLLSENDCRCDDCILGLNDAIECNVVTENGEKTLQKHLKKRKKVR